MKQIISVLLALVMVIGVLPVTVLAATEVASGTCGENVNWTLDSEGLLVISGSGPMMDYGLGYTGTQLINTRAPWNTYRKKITCVDIAEGITKIGAYAFYECINLSEIRMPDSVANIGSFAFYSTAISSITIPNEVTSLEWGVFYDCKNLTDVNLPNGLTTIGIRAFTNCSGLKEILIPNSVETIALEAFDNCTSLSKLHIPGGVVKIGQDAFSGCIGLTEISIPESVTSIGEGAFSGCKGLLSAEMPSGITSISSRLFAGCISLVDVTIPASVTSIGASAFYNCSDLPDISIPASVTNIGAQAFCKCNGLTNVNIPDSVTDIGAGAFSECASLTGIHIPESVMNIGARAFEKCISLVNVESLGGITSVGEETFSGCINLNDVNIPDSVTCIEKRAFSGCSSLEIIQIPESVTDIKLRAFEKCINLSSINLPGGITSMGNYVFEGCASLKNVCIMDGVAAIATGTFKNCDNLSEIVLPKSVTSIGAEAFYGCDSLNSIVIPNGVTRIGDNAFYSCSYLSNVVIPDSVTSIGEGAFAYSCFASITIPNSVTNIGEKAFLGTYLSSVLIPDSISRIRESTFRQCSKLVSVMIPASITRIDDGAFYKCTSLTDVYYEGSKEQWDKVNRESFGENVTIHYDSIWPEIREYRLELYPGVEELTVATGAQLQVTCSLYYGDQLVVDWDQPGISIGNTGALSFVRCDQVSDGYCLTVQAHDIGKAELIFCDNASGATLTVPVQVVSDISGDDHLRKEWVRQHMEYATSEEYQTEIVAGYRGRMNAVFDDIIEDEGIKFYDFTDKFINFTNGKFEADQSDMYELLLAELMYASLEEDMVYELFEENYHQAVVDVMDTLCKGLSESIGLVADEELIKSMKELVDVLKTMNKRSPGFADTANKLLSLVDENFTPQNVVKNLRSGAAVTGLGIVFDGALEAYNTCADILTYSYNSVAYSYTSDDFEKVMYALADKVSNDFGPENFPELGEKDREINWRDFEKALRSFCTSLRAQKACKADDLGQYAVKRIKEGATNFASETITTLAVYGVESVISCVPILGQIQTAIGAVGLIKSAAELLTDIDEQSYRLDMLTKLYCISVALDSVVDDFAKELSEDYFWKSTAFDESVTLYKAAQLKALEYMIEYEKTLLSEVYWEKINYELTVETDLRERERILKEFEEHIVWYENAVRILEENRPRIRSITCHDSTLRYDPATDQIIATYQNVQLYVVACPVSVIVLSQTGEQIAYLSNDVCEVMLGHELYFQTVEMDKNESIKLAFVPQGYQIRVKGENDGEMDIFATNTENTMTYSLDIPVASDFVADIEKDETGDMKIITNLIGELTFDGKVDVDDVLALLWNVLFPDDYPMDAEADFDESGTVDVDDVLALLWHVLFPDEYPI